MKNEYFQLQQVFFAFETSGFFEREIARRAETFGHIAHLFSTYPALFTKI